MQPHPFWNSGRASWDAFLPLDVNRSATALFQQPICKRSKPKIPLSNLTLLIVIGANHLFNPTTVKEHRNNQVVGYPTSYSCAHMVWSLAVSIPACACSFALLCAVCSLFIYLFFEIAILTSRRESKTKNPSTSFAFNRNRVRGAFLFCDVSQRTSMWDSQSSPPE